MPFPVQCSECSKRFSAPDKFADRTIPCPNCKASIFCAAIELQPLEPEPIFNPFEDDVPQRGAFDLSDEFDSPAPATAPSKLKAKPASTKRRRAKWKKPSWFADDINWLWLGIAGVFLILALLFSPYLGTSTATKEGLGIRLLSGYYLIWGIMLAAVTAGVALLGRDSWISWIDRNVPAFFYYLGAIGALCFGIFAAVVAEGGLPNKFAAIGAMFFCASMLALFAWLFQKFGFSKVGGIFYLLGAPFGLIFLMVFSTEATNRGSARSGIASSVPSSSSEISRPPKTLPNLQLFPYQDIERGEVRIPFDGGRIKLIVYAPANRPFDQKLATVFVAPAGAIPLTGNQPSSSYADECLPWAEAGFAVVSYEVSGAIQTDRPSLDQLKNAIDEFHHAKGGVENVRAAMDYVAEKVPFVDPDRLYCAGHSSAGTVSLLVAAKERRIKGCVAFAPVTNLDERLRDDANTHDFYRESHTDLDSIVRSNSPIIHAKSITCPVFLFHDSRDGNVPVSQSEAMRGAIDSPVTLKLVDHSDHYTSMIKVGIPAAIEWLTKLDGKTTTPEPASTIPGRSRPAPGKLAAADNDDRPSGEPLAERRARRETSRRDRDMRPGDIVIAASGEARLELFYQTAKEAYVDQLAVLIANEGDLENRMELWAAGKRPTIGFRFGIGILFSGEGQRFQPHDWDDFADKLGTFGSDVTGWLNDGMLAELAGEWPKVHFASSGIELVGAADNADSLKEDGRDANIDCLITIGVTQRFVRNNWVPTFQITTEDLHGRIPSWESKSLSNRKMLQEGSGSILFALEEHLKKSYRTRDMPNMSREKVAKRIKSMKRSENRKWLVAEVIYYYQSELLPYEVAYNRLSKIAPNLDAKAVLSNSVAERYSAVHDWLD